MRRTTAVLYLFSLAASAGAAPAPAPPAAGGLTALPERAAQPVPLSDPGFEEGAKGWTIGPPGAFSTPEGAGPHAGKACLRLDCGAKTPWVPSAALKLKDVGPGTYTLRFWAKSQGLDAKGGGGRVSIEYLRQNGARSWPSTDVLNGTSDWHQEALSVLIPQDMKPGSVAISIHRYGATTGGEVCFDDVSLEQILPPAAEAFILYPNYRGFLPADGPQQVRLWVRANDAQAKAPAVVTVTDAAGKPVAKATAAAAPGGSVVTLDAAQWKPGSYSVQASLGAYRYPAYRIRKITAAERARIRMWFDPDQNLHVQGKAQFPIGIYNTLAKFGALDQSDLDKIGKMAEAPITLNTNYWAWSLGAADRRRYWGAMQQHGILFLETVNHMHPPVKLEPYPIADELLPEAKGNLATQELMDRYLAKLAGALPGIPGFGGWYAMDEMGFGRVPEVFHQLQVLKAADPDHPTMAVSNAPGEMDAWRDAADVLGTDPYPLFNMKAGQPLSLVGEWTRSAVDATHGSRPVWTVLQFFQGWSTDRWPTKEELRSMGLMAVVEGARGIFYWSMGNRALAWAKETEREEYWQRLVSAAKELKSLEPALLAPDAPALVKAVSEPKVRWRARQAGGKTYVFFYLPAEKFAAADAPAVTVRFDLADGRSVTREIRPDSADWFAAP